MVLWLDVQQMLLCLLLDAEFSIQFMRVRLIEAFFSFGS